MADQPQRKRVPLGAPLSREALMRLSKITAADVRRAQRTWRLNAPPKYRRLLDAVGARISDAIDRAA